MSSEPLAAGIRQLRGRMAVQYRNEESDEQLLYAFTTRRDEDAFAVLVRRYGPMVLHVCRRVLGQQQDAEDAFQAVFLLLARNAAKVRNKSALAGFLHGAAYRIALTAKRSAARRRKHEGAIPSETRPSVNPIDELSWREVRTLLDDEIARLPEKYRTVFVLCHLENLSQAEAARRLGMNERTLSSRLTEARKRLSRRLARRGVELTALLSATALAQQSASALPAGLMATTIKAAVVTASGEELAGIAPASVVELLQRAKSAMLASKAKIAVVFLLAATLAAGAGVWACRMLATTPPIMQAKTQAASSPPATAKTNGPSDSAAGKVEKPEMMSVTGHVLDPEGKPLTGARLTVLAGTQRVLRSGGLRREQQVLSQGTSDREGQFRLTVPRTSSLPNGEIDVVATHDRYGLAWQSFDADAAQPTVVVHLHPEQILRGRLIDLQGQPVVGAKLQIVRIYNGRGSIALDGLRHIGFVWPKPIDTDKSGQFVIHGLGGRASVSLCSDQEQCAPQRLELTAGETKTYVLAPARLLEGRVLYADTGKPAPHVEVGAWGVSGETDELGWFRLRPTSGPIYNQEESGLVLAYAPKGEPYLNVQKEFRWPKATLKHRVDLALPRGVSVRGQVTEKASGKPVAGALVFYQAQLNNSNSKRAEAGLNNYANGRNAVTSKPDGTFQIACHPGPGYLTIEGPEPDFALGENGGYDQLFFGKRGGQPWLSHGFAAVDLKLGDKPPEIAITLRKGVTLTATVTGPAGQSVGDLQVFCPLEGFAVSPVKVRGNRLELHGCDAEKSLRVMVFDAKNQWGATVETSKQNAGETPLPIRLAPCGSVRVRFLDAEGKPLAKFHPGLFLELAPKHGEFREQATQVYSPIPSLKSGPHTDEQGWCTLISLIPGATYRFGHTEIETTLIAKPGEVLKLPDVVMK
jgi:RNA polymerase sigma factor (sigma-70 family)